MKRFKPIKNPFGGIDEMATQREFEEFVGGHRRAERLLWLYNNSYPQGTNLDFLYGDGRAKDQVFASKAKREGFSQAEIDAFFSL